MYIYDQDAGGMGQETAQGKILLAAGRISCAPALITTLALRIAGSLSHCNVRAGGTPLTWSAF